MNYQNNICVRYLPYLRYTCINLHHGAIILIPTMIQIMIVAGSKYLVSWSLLWLYERLVKLNSMIQTALPGSGFWPMFPRWSTVKKVPPIDDQLLSVDMRWWIENMRWYEIRWDKLSWVFHIFFTCIITTHPKLVPNIYKIIPIRSARDPRLMNAFQVRDPIGPRVTNQPVRERFAPFTDLFFLF